MAAEWTVERTAHRRFPFRITIRQGDRLLLAVRTQSPWPGPGQQLFCLREPVIAPDEQVEVLERVPVAHLGRVGLLPRAMHLGVVVDSAEQYPWRFPGATVRRRKLSVGDYALLDGERIVATVERKTFDNLLVDVGSVQALHHHLAQLAARPCPALVIEAQYADFLDERRLAGRWPAAHLARVLAEIAALHSGLPVVFAGNRKLANAWCYRFFTACATREASPQLDLVREVVAGYDPLPEDGLDERVRGEAVRGFEEPFRFGELAARFPGVPASRLRRLLLQLRSEGLLATPGWGRGTRWAPAPGAG